MNSTVSRHVIGTVLMLAATAAAARLTAHRKAAQLIAPLSSIPRQIEGFTGTDNPPLSDGILHELRASSYLSRSYKNGGITADLFIAYYAQQRAGESMHSPKHCLPGAGWEIWNYGTAIVPVNGRGIQVNRYSISRVDVRALVLYWYQSKDRIVASEYLGKILLARDAFLQNSTAASIVRIIVPDIPGAADTASMLAAVVIPEVKKCFGN